MLICWYPGYIFYRREKIEAKAVRGGNPMSDPEKPLFTQTCGSLAPYLEGAPRSVEHLCRTQKKGRGDSEARKEEAYHFLHLEATQRR
jgi:hypothetical protein